MNKKEGDDFFGGDVFELVHENTEKKIKMSKYYEYSYATGKTAHSKVSYRWVVHQHQQDRLNSR